MRSSDPVQWPARRSRSPAAGSVRSAASRRIGRSRRAHTLRDPACKERHVSTPPPTQRTERACATLCGNDVLHVEDRREVLVEALRPELPSVRYPQESHCHSQLIAATLQRTVEHCIDAQLAACRNRILIELRGSGAPSSVERSPAGCARLRLEISDSVMPSSSDSLRSAGSSGLNGRIASVWPARGAGSRVLVGSERTMRSLRPRQSARQRRRRSAPSADALGPGAVLAGYCGRRPLRWLDTTSSSRRVTFATNR